jgi:phospho-N-acetylmuramoyl-pentapeptide-transferase
MTDQLARTLAGMVVLGVAAGLMTVVTTRPLVSLLRSRQIGKAIRVDGPAHAEKEGTPTMGGLAALGVIAVLALTIAWWTGAVTQVLLVLACAGAFAVLGMVDDLAGLARTSHEHGVGLTARRMFALQVLVALAVCVPLVMPLTGDPVRMIAALLIGLLAIVGTVNGVNMSDGLDGLAAGLLALAFAAIGVAAALSGPHHEHLLSLAGASPEATARSTPLLSGVVVGACLGFLVFNRHPARVFMGNVTSMALGATLAVLSLTSGTWPLLPVIGAVFVAEVVSVIVQVVVFKRTGGRRFFRMAPLHHHYEALGWPETLVVKRFWIAGALAGLAGVALSLLSPLGT